MNPLLKNYLRKNRLNTMPELVCIAIISTVLGFLTVMAVNFLAGIR